MGFILGREYNLLLLNGLVYLRIFSQHSVWKVSKGKVDSRFFAVPDFGQAM